MVTVPNKPKNSAKNFRIEDDVWAEAIQIAESQGTRMSALLRDFVYRYVEENRSAG